MQNNYKKPSVRNRIKEIQNRIKNNLPTKNIKHTSTPTTWTENGFAEVNNGPNVSGIIKNFNKSSKKMKLSRKRKTRKNYRRF